MTRQRDTIARAAVETLTLAKEIAEAEEVTIEVALKAIEIALYRSQTPWTR